MDFCLDLLYKSYDTLLIIFFTFTNIIILLNYNRQCKIMLLIILADLSNKLITSFINSARAMASCSSNNCKAY